MTRTTRMGYQTNGRKWQARVPETNSWPPFFDELNGVNGSKRRQPKPAAGAET
jgi:hypothetical protein